MRTTLSMNCSQIVDLHEVQTELKYVREALVMQDEIGMGRGGGGAQ